MQLPPQWAIVIPLARSGLAGIVCTEGIIPLRGKLIHLPPV